MLIPSSQQPWNIVSLVWTLLLASDRNCNSNWFENKGGLIGAGSGVELDLGPPTLSSGLRNFCPLWAAFLSTEIPLATLSLGPISGKLWGWKWVCLSLPAVLSTQTIGQTVNSSGKPQKFVQVIPLHFVVHSFLIHDLGWKTSLTWTRIGGSGGWVFPGELWKEILPVTWKCCFPKVLSSWEHFLLLLYKEGQWLTEMM